MASRSPDVVSFIELTPHALIEIFRWRIRRQRQFRETVLEHTHKQVELAIIVALIERELNQQTGIDWFELVTLAHCHDVGEIATGDPAAVAKKTDCSLGDAVDEAEYQYFKQLLADAPQCIREKYLEIHSLQHEDSPIGRLFQAIERLGYVIYALNEIRHGTPGFEDVIEKNVPHIAELGREFSSIMQLLNILQPEIETVLNKELRES